MYPIRIKRKNIQKQRNTLTTVTSRGISGALSATGDRQDRVRAIALKQEFQSELHAPRSALLVLGRDGAQALVESLSGLSKDRMCQGRIDIAKNWVIEDVERFGSKLEPESFPK